MSGRLDDETGGHGGDLARASERWNLNSGELIDFSSNINPLGPPPGLLDHLREALPGIVAYPTPQARELREELGNFLAVPADRLLLGNGASELIHLIILWRRPKRVFVPAPSFSEYERAASLAGSAVERYSLMPGEEADLAAVGRKLKSGDLLVFCNPNNPTGILYPRRELMSLVDAAAERGAEIMIDESFIPLTGKPGESLREPERYNLWVITSLTKVWSLPGLRLGCAAGPRKDIEELTSRGDPWRVNCLAQAAGLYCLGSSGYLEESLALIDKERAYLAGGFLETGSFHVFEGSANYLFIMGLQPGFEVAGYRDYLAKRGILIRRADNFHNLDHRYFRVAVRRRPENRRLLQETAGYLKSGKFSLNNIDRGGEKA